MKMSPSKSSDEKYRWSISYKLFFFLIFVFGGELDFKVKTKNERKKKKFDEVYPLYKRIKS